MSFETQLLQYALMRAQASRYEDRGEISATTIVWAAALVLLAVGVSLALVTKIKAKADSIDLGA